MIIETEKLFKWMDDHNIHSVTKDQLMRFSHERSSNDFERGVIAAYKMLVVVLNTRIALLEKPETIKQCGNCDYLQPDVDVCLCERSENCNKFIDKLMVCQEWKKNE